MRRLALAIATLAGAACQGGMAGDPGPGTGAPDGGLPPGFEDLDVARAQERFKTTTDLMRYVIAPGCAAERNECHFNEDFPDMSTEGNLVQLIGLRCNQGIGDRLTVEDFCERPGDQLRITDGANAGFTAGIGSVTSFVADDGAFQHWELKLDQPVPQGQSGGSFELLRDGAPLAALGGGGSLQADPGSAAVRLTNQGNIPDPFSIRQGDENQNGVFGLGEGSMVKPGSARDSYLVHRLLGQETARQRMPLGENADTENEANRLLTPDEMYAIMSWINCMQPGDGPYADIRYDCPANAGNVGTW